MSTFDNPHPEAPPSPFSPNQPGTISENHHSVTSHLRFAFPPASCPPPTSTSSAPVTPVARFQPIHQEDPAKRSRDEHHVFIPDASLDEAPHHKRSRGNTYIAPHKIPPSFTGAMGTLAPHPHGKLRRQLSGSKLDGFLGSGDKDDMDVDMGDTRPRSMSF